MPSESSKVSLAVKRVGDDLEEAAPTIKNIKDNFGIIDQMVSKLGATIDELSNSIGNQGDAGSNGGFQKVIDDSDIPDYTRIAGDLPETIKHIEQDLGVLKAKLGSLHGNLQQLNSIGSGMMESNGYGINGVVGRQNDGSPVDDGSTNPTLYDMKPRSISALNSFLSYASTQGTVSPEALIFKIRERLTAVGLWFDFRGFENIPKSFSTKLVRFGGKYEVGPDGKVHKGDFAAGKSLTFNVKQNDKGGGWLVNARIVG